MEEVESDRKPTETRDLSVSALAGRAAPRDSAQYTCGHVSQSILCVAAVSTRLWTGQHSV